MTEIITESFFQNICASSFINVFNHQTSAIIWIKDKDGIYQFANEAYLRKVMMVLPELIGKKDEDFTPQYLADAYRLDDQSVLAGREIRKRIELIAFKGEPYDWYMTDKFALKDFEGKAIATLGMTRKVERLSKPDQPDPDILRVMKYIRENYKSELSIHYMAKLSRLSMSAFERKFKKTFQLTPTDYVLRFRLNCVCNDLIHSNETISNIAFSNGFSDHSYMSRQFKKIIGTSPKQFRKTQHAD